jgi:hypothetical protein
MLSTVSREGGVKQDGDDLRCRRLATERKQNKRNKEKRKEKSQGAIFVRD